MTRPTEEAALSAGIRRRAHELGFGLVGITTPVATSHVAHYRAWLGSHYHGEMRYLARPDAVERREDLSGTLESVRSVIVVGHTYDPEDSAGVPEDPSLGVIARYARGRDYHRVIVPRLRALHGWLEDHLDRPVSARAYADTGPILERDLARRAGLGWFGKNTMVIHPKRGSYFLLGVLLLDLDLQADAPFQPDHCGSCRACLDGCPTGALLGRNENGAPVMDARRCISYLTIELRGAIPRDLRPLMGNRVFGCDICQELCPFNRRFAAPADDPAYAARGPGATPVGADSLPSDVSHPGTKAPSLLELMAMDSQAWESFSRGSAIRRAGRVGFRRNVVIALGNWGSADAVPTLIRALADPEPLVRGHAAWALGRIGSAAARNALAQRLQEEADPFVQEELELSLSPPGAAGAR